MKLAELCTVFPRQWNAPAPRHPGGALPLDVRIKLKAQKGHLQAALDTHVQRTANRSGLGLRPYMAGDSLRAVSLRHLMLQEEILTRTDVAAGRFHVVILVHCYGNMEYSSQENTPNKQQLAWATAGILENLHEQQAQKVEVLALQGPHLGEEINRHAARLRRAHFCYVITDLLDDPASKNASVEALGDVIRHLRMPRGLVLVIRDLLESPDIVQTDWASDDKAWAFAAPANQLSAEIEQERIEHHSGSVYLQNMENQLNELEAELNVQGWSSFWLNSEHTVEKMLHRLTVRLSALRIAP